MCIRLLFVALISLVSFSSVQAQAIREEPIDVEIKTKKLVFKSLDGLQITADHYYLKNQKTKGLIILCHQAGWSRGEYKEIAPKLLLRGYACLAIDQRSGGEVNNVTNQTAQRAKELKKKTTYLDAEQDIVAAVRWAKKHHVNEKLILWGSSYSSSLVLKVAQDEGVDKVLSFSPGEYFGDKMILTQKINKLNIPVFITCAKREIKRTQGIFDSIPSNQKTFFKPSTSGNHGSRALWSKFEDHNAYWKAVKAFLNKN